MTSVPIALVGMACRFPDARTPLELWENVLAGRRAFRRLPRQRVPLDEYASDDRAAPDLAYHTRAAVLDCYRFDRVRFKVSLSTFTAVDLAHWLALNVAADALEDAGFSDASGLPRQTTGVLVGNTLTGEFSRAGALRVRWPYVRRVVDAVLEEAGESPERRTRLLPQIESLFKAPFAPFGGETLAGSLSNTIAGRICNYFNLKGGGYTVDGACASSLLAVAHACSALGAGDLDVAVAGGVDLSLDPFELVGFAKAGALASDDMRVYDAAPTGFWPGEGAGFVVLMREADALARQKRIYAVIRGWGVSSDGNGGMTRPELEGQLLAINRAYARAEVPVETVACFEGHGTGTAIGDAVELTALSEARRGAGARVRAAAVSSIKGNIGHTKAAAGIAGLLKATQSVHREIIPPASGCRQPHPLLTSPDAVLYVPDRATAWPADVPRLAGVSAMGFGGINVHLLLEGRGHPSQATRDADLACARAWQDAELVLLTAASPGELREKIDRLIAIVPDLSIAEVTDLAVHLQHHATSEPVRAAFVASTPVELAGHLRLARAAIDAGTPVFDAADGVFVGASANRPRVAFLYPGQGAPVRTSGGGWSRRYAEVEALYRRTALARAADASDTAVAQPAIVTGCVAGTHVLRSAGIEADVAIGHSLGELAALWWAGAFDDDTVIALAAARGHLMATLAIGPGAMAAIGAPQHAAEALLEGTAATVAAINGSHQIIVAGTAGEVATVLARARDRRISASALRVSHAFHSPLMAAVGPALRRRLAATPVHSITRTVISTVTGQPIGDSAAVAALLERQLREPVRFTDALDAAGTVDLFIEVGPGQALAALASAATGVPAVSVDAGSDSVRGLLTALGAAFVVGAPLDPARLAHERFARPFDLDRPKDFLVNPCELARAPDTPAIVSASCEAAPSNAVAGSDATDAVAGEDTCTVLRRLVAQAVALPLDAIAADARFLTDLHLNSLMVSELLMNAARRIGVVPPVSPTDYADATIEEAAKALDHLGSSGVAGAGDAAPDGLDTWVRAFTMIEQAEPLPTRPGTDRRGEWRIVSSPEHPLRDALLRRFADAEGGPGIVVCLDPGFAPTVGLLLAAAQTALRERLRHRFVIVQQDATAGGFARSLFLESSHLDVGVVTIDFSSPLAAEHTHAEACATDGFAEVRYDSEGRRFVSMGRVTALGPDTNSVALGCDDVLLVTGGGKGIAAECAMALASATGVRLVLMGRSRPESDPALAANLARIAESGATVRYVVADVTDEEQVRSAIETIREEFGEVSAVLHAAGANTPALIAALDADAIAAAVAPKVNGARNVLSAVDPARLRLFISFGSIIARTGFPGEAHYALANEWLRELTAKLAADLPGCRALTIEWSVWAAAGMGERLGRLDALARRGVAPITIESGVAVLKSLLTAAELPSAVIVAGRFGHPSPLRLARCDLPLRRFIESPRVHYPGVELVADATLSIETDPYLADHCMDGQLLFPAVMGLEAMVQAAMAVANTAELPVLQQVEFARPIVVPRDGSLILRTMALADEDGGVRVALRADTTGFTLDHFRAVCTWPPLRHAVSGGDVSSHAPADQVQIDPVNDLYGTLLFQSGRFARVGRYQRLLATECAADLTAGAPTWFGPYVADSLVLGDPGLRDAALHSIQACIPHRRLVPVAVERIVTHRPLRGPCRVRASEQSANGDEFTWHIQVVDETGAVVEAWHGARFRGIAAVAMHRVRAALLIPYLQRRLDDLGHAPLRVRVELNSAGERSGRPSSNRRQRRPDGKPDRINGNCTSTAHAGALTVRVAASQAIGCDLEGVTRKPWPLWRDLLGVDRAAVAELIARERSEPPDASATRVWAAMESLKKAGAGPNTPLVLQVAQDDGWVRLGAGRYTVSTWIGDLGQPDAMAFAIATSE